MARLLDGFIPFVHTIVGKTSSTRSSSTVAASAERVLARLPEFAAAAIVEFITGPLLENPRRVGNPLMLDLSGYHSARRGAYRVIYRIDDSCKCVIVVRIDHRADVYRAR